MVVGEDTGKAPATLVTTISLAPSALTVGPPELDKLPEESVADVLAWDVAAATISNEPDCPETDGDWREQGQSVSV